MQAMPVQQTLKHQPHLRSLRLAQGMQNAAFLR